MTDGWKEGDPVPTGLAESSVAETAAMALMSGLVMRSGMAPELAVVALVDGWAEATRANSAEGTAQLIVALCALAAGPVLRLAELEGADPRHLIQAEVVAMEALAGMMRGGEAP